MALAKAAAGGDGDAWEQLYRQLKPQLMKLMCKFVGKDNAEDLVQDVFLQLFKKLDQYQGRSRLSTWAYRTAINCALMHLRKKRLETVSLEDEFISRAGEEAGIELQIPSEDTHLRDAEIRLRLEQALAQLPPEERQLIVMYDVEGYSHQEIADLLGEDSRKRMKNARISLRAKLASN